MKKWYKITGIGILIFVSSLIIVNYLSKASPSPGTISGHIVLLDQKPASDLRFGTKQFSLVLYLPSSTCEGNYTFCDLFYPSGGERADINKDGYINAIDILAIIRCFTCSSSDPCWNQSIPVSAFEYKGNIFFDPDRDGKMTQSDIDNITNCLGQNFSAIKFDPTCENNPCCRADINKDGYVTEQDLLLAEIKLNQYADSPLFYILTKDLDISENGEIDIYDLISVSSSYGEKAENKCISRPLTYLGGNKWLIDIQGNNIYHVEVSYSCTIS